MKMFLLIIALCISLSSSHPSIVEPQQTKIDLPSIQMPLQDSDATDDSILSGWTAQQGPNPEELGPYFEGDMLLSEVHYKNGMLEQRYRWPNSIVPYAISPSVSFTDQQQILRAIHAYHSQTCIKFVPRTSEKDFISFENTAAGCWSSVGRVGRKQTINLQSPGCTTTIGTPLHEIMHALGFVHEQSRKDRDSHVRIFFENVMTGKSGNFEKAKQPTTDFGVPYDIESIMHYSPTAFSLNGQRTIESLMGEHVTRRMGQRGGFSPSDLIKINAMYCKK